MIKEICYTKDWFLEFRKQRKYKKLDPGILEKMIHAMGLLQQLCESELDFIFKGGTSLVLLLNSSNRFSIDIDIVTQGERRDIERILDELVDKLPFNKWELQEHRSYKNGIPKAHYRFDYTSVVDNRSNNVILDILYEKTLYPEVRNISIDNQWIEVEGETVVKVPSVDSIIGDKLTAFAPNTTGVLYGSNKELQIIKQLFDLGELFNSCSDVRVVAQSFSAFAEKEIEYRKLNISPNDVLDDAINTAAILSTKGQGISGQTLENYNELHKGIRALKSHLITNNYNIDEAIIPASKVAFMAAILKTSKWEKFIRFDNDDVTSKGVDNPDWKYLNRLKRLPNKVPFYYWSMTDSLIKDDNT